MNALHRAASHTSEPNHVRMLRHVVREYAPALCRESIEGCWLELRKRRRSQRRG